MRTRSNTTALVIKQVFLRKCRGLKVARHLLRKGDGSSCIEVTSGEIQSEVKNQEPLG
jgi:hypothetical protein